MNETIKEIFNLYQPLLDEINLQLKNDIVRKNLDIFNDNKTASNKLRYDTIKDNLNLSIKENDNYNFRMIGVSLNAQISLKCVWVKNVSELRLNLKLKKSNPTELYIHSINIFNANKILEDKVSIHFTLHSNFYFEFDIDSGKQRFQFTFDNKNLEPLIEKNSFWFIDCPNLLPYLEKYQNLFPLYQQEPKAVSELLLKDKRFTQHQEDLFKLLYDFDSFDTKNLSLNLFLLQEKNDNNLKLKS